MNRYPSDTGNIDRIVREHDKLVRRIAHHVHFRVRSIVEYDDLLQIGLIGLIEAAQRYSRQDGVSFESYAVLRIRGAMHDYLRKNSVLCRKSIKINQAINSAKTKLMQDLGRTPEKHELAQSVSMTLEEYTQWEQTLNASYQNSLQDEYDEHSMWFASDEPLAEQRLDRERLKETLLAALRTLPEREILVLQMYYVEELNLHEIATVLDVTPGRVSQIKSAAFKKMQPLLKAHADDVRND